MLKISNGVKRIMAAATLGLMLGPVLAVAQTSTGNTTRTKPERTTNSVNSGTPANFCSRIANVKSELNTKLNNLEKDRGERRTEISNKLKERKDNRIVQVQKKRDEAKKKFNDAISNLNTSATTDGQKAAITAFKSAVESANTTRRAAVDAAMKTHRDSVSALVTQRQDTIKTAASTFRSSVLSAISKAQSDCSTGVESATARQTLGSSIKAAKDKFHADRQAAEKIGQKIKDLAKTRNDAIRAANEAFKVSAQAARQTLKAAFPSA